MEDDDDDCGHYDDIVAIDDYDVDNVTDADNDVSANDGDIDDDVVSGNEDDATVSGDDNDDDATA